MSSRFKLTKTAKVLIFILILAVIGGGVFAGVKTGFIKTSKDVTSDNEESNIADIFSESEDSSETVADDGSVINTDKTDEATINLSLDEWIGWKSIIDANGGLSTKDGSIYDKLGIKVNISVINDATQSSNALISGKLDAAGYTINRTAFLSTKFKEAGVDVIMPFITNFSNGGDGIIAKSDIKTVADLVDVKVGVPQFSEAHTLVVWFVNQSDLSKDDKQKIIDNLIFFETPDEAAKAFFAGQIDVAATWEPYLTQAQNMSDAHILFSTASSSSLVMDGILFNKAFAEANPEVVTKFIDGALTASDLYDKDMTTIKSVMPMFSTASDQDIKDNCAGARLMTYADNLNMFSGTARTIYTSMSEVWKSIGESAETDLVDTLYDDKYITALADKYDSADITKIETVTVTDDNRTDVIDTIALLEKSTTINFVANTAKFLDSAEASSQMDEFIAIAKVLDGTIIQIEGNIASDNDSEDGKMLSKQRAESVKKYFIMNGIDANRIIVIGNGGTKPVAPNTSEENMAQNRRTDIFFKIVE